MRKNIHICKDTDIIIYPALKSEKDRDMKPRERIVTALRCGVPDRVIWAQQKEWGDPLTVWHSGSSSLAYADGHAERRKWSAETVDAFLAPEDFGGFKPTTASGIEDLEWMVKGWPK